MIHARGCTAARLIRGSQDAGMEVVLVASDPDMESYPTTSGSLIEKNNIAKFDSTIVSKLKDAGANIFGKLNLHEFAFGPTGLNPHYGDQKNPWNPEHMTGGSSGGSGNSVVTSQVPISIGSDTGGSIRIPSSLCGSYGFKPTLVA